MPDKRISISGPDVWICVNNNVQHTVHNTCKYSIHKIVRDGNIPVSVQTSQFTAIHKGNVCALKSSLNTYLHDDIFTRSETKLASSKILRNEHLWSNSQEFRFPGEEQDGKGIEGLNIFGSQEFD